MTQIIVTLDGNKTAIDNIIQSIKKLKGVVKTAFYKGDAKDIVSSVSTVSPRIRKLRGVAKGITKEQTEEDDRLAYIINK